VLLIGVAAACVTLPGDPTIVESTTTPVPEPGATASDALDPSDDSSTPILDDQTRDDQTRDDQPRDGRTDDDETEAATVDVANPGHPAPLEGAVPITVRWILDGDSIEADTPWGNVEVRLLGTNANEGDECFGEEAKDALISRLAKEEAQLWTEVHETYGPDRDEYGRLLAYVWQGERLINLDQIADGYAVARSAFGHPLEAAFDAAEATARDEARGLWSPTACGTGAASNTAIAISDLNFDAAGRDDENPNGEWIELVNESAESIDLTGWMIRDESTRHRYEFPADLVLAPAGRVRLRSGCGDDALANNPIELHWCDPFGPVWSNSGDTAIVQDPVGNIVVSESWDSIYE